MPAIHGAQKRHQHSALLRIKEYKELKNIIHFCELIFVNINQGEGVGDTQFPLQSSSSQAPKKMTAAISVATVTPAKTI